MRACKDKSPFLNKEMRHMMLKLAILAHVKRKRLHTYALVKHFDQSQAGRILFSSDVKNDVYNTVKGLESSGYLKSAVVLEHGRAKRYLALTAKGASALTSSKRLFMRSMRDLEGIMR